LSQTEGLKKSEDYAAKAEMARRRESEDKRTEGKRKGEDEELKKTKGDMYLVTMWILLRRVICELFSKKI